MGRCCTGQTAEVDATANGTTVLGSAHEDCADAALATIVTLSAYASTVFRFSESFASANANGSARLSRTLTQARSLT